MASAKQARGSGHNILWFTTDHQIYHQLLTRYRHLCPLPNAERICREGIRFRQAYTSCPLCSPARASMMTGVYPHRHGIRQNVPAGGRGFRPGQRFFHEPLLEAGYRVGFFGKWHCGDDRLPQDLGCEGWSASGYGHPYGSDAYRSYLGRIGAPFPTTVRCDWSKDDPEAVGLSHPLGNTWGPFSSSGVLEGPEEVHEAHFVAHLAEQWLDEAAHDPQPFLLRVDVWGPHQPYHSAGEVAGAVPPEAVEPYPSFDRSLEGLPRCYALADARVGPQRPPGDWTWWRRPVARALEQTMVVDRALGRLLDALDRLAIADRTLVIVTSDHGDLLASHGGLFNKDAIMVEETLRVPLLMRWPGRIPEGATSDALVSNLDLPATVLAAAGRDAPGGYDGRDLLPVATGAASTIRDALLIQSFGCFGPDHDQRALRWRNLAYILHHGEGEELYDLEADPFQVRNLAGQDDRTKWMRARLFATMSDHEDAFENE